MNQIQSNHFSGNSKRLAEFLGAAQSLVGGVHLPLREFGQRSDKGMLQKRVVLRGESRQVAVARRLHVDCRRLDNRALVNASRRVFLQLFTHQ